MPIEKNVGHRWEKGNIPWNKDKKGLKRKPLSEERKQKMRKAMLKNNPGGFQNGENHHLWRGGTRAYYSKIAHAVWEKYWRQKVPEGQLIHHFDENRKNNEITNLVNMSLSFHAKYHMLKRKKEEMKLLKVI